MKRSSKLGIAAGVLAVMAAVFGFLAANHYAYVSSARRAADAAGAVMVPTVLAFICLGGAIVAVIAALAAGGQSSSGSGAGSGASGDL